MAKRSALPPINLEVDASRVVQQPTGEFYVDLTNADFAGRVPGAVEAARRRGDDRAEVPINLTVRGDSRDYGDRLYMRLPDAKVATHIPDKDIRRVGARVLKPGKKAEVTPTLAGELMFAKDAWLPTAPKKQQDMIKDALRRSRQFVFDTGASLRVAQMCRDNPDLIADYSEFVRPPFPVTWIEVEARTIWEAMTGTPSDVDADTRLGFMLWSHGDSLHLYTAAMGGQDNRDAQWLPFCYHLNAPSTLAEQLEACRLLTISRAALDGFYWGSAFDQLDPSRRKALRSQHGLTIVGGQNMPDGMLAHFASGGGGPGDLKLALAAFMLLLRPDMTTVVRENGPSRRLSAGKVKTFLAHTVVTVKLSPERLVRRVVAAAKDAARAIRWHEVRAHYCHNKAAKEAGCIHDWEEVEPNKWQCRHNPAHRRWWRQFPNGRGDASVGVVTKHYHVKP